MKEECVYLSVGGDLAAQFGLKAGTKTQSRFIARRSIEIASSLRLFAGCKEVCHDLPFGDVLRGAIV
jgi:hypothetical protein